MNNAKEKRLIKQAQRGDTAAFEALVQEHGLYVYNLALRIMRHPQEAEDLAQEAFLRAWQALPRFRAEARFTTWLYRIVTNLCYNRLPQLKRELNVLNGLDEVLLGDERQNTGRAYLNEEMRRDIHAAIDNLADSYRLLITLRHLQGLSYAEIAEVTGMPLGTVKTGIYRARRQLREALETWNEIA